MLLLRSCISREILYNNHNTSRRVISLQNYFFSEHSRKWNLCSWEGRCTIFTMQIEVFVFFYFVFGAELLVASGSRLSKYSCSVSFSVLSSPVFPAPQFRFVLYAYPVFSSCPFLVFSFPLLFLLFFSRFIVIISNMKKTEIWTMSKLKNKETPNLFLNGDLNVK